MLPSDCISVETNKIPVLIEPELVVPVVLNEPAVISPVAVIEATLSEVSIFIVGCLPARALSTYDLL
jgi:hypothetical protein